MSSPIWGLWPDVYYSLTVMALFSGAPSLTRGRVCLLYLLLAFANVVFLGSESLGARDHILLSQISDFPFRRLFTTRRVTVEVFEHSSTEVELVGFLWHRLGSDYSTENTSVAQRLIYADYTENNSCNTVSSLLCIMVVLVVLLASCGCWRAWSRVMR
jgi:hypothetical protein